MSFKVEGWARKAAIPLVCISAIGWFVYVVGYGLFYSEFVNALARTSVIFPDPPGLRGFAPFWIFLASGLPLYILSAVYLVTGNSILGLATNFFTILSLVTGGGALLNTGVTIDTFSSNSLLLATPSYQYLATTFAGSLISVLFLGIFALLWPFFIINTPEYCMNLTEEDRMAFSGRHSQQPQPAAMQPVYHLSSAPDYAQVTPAVAPTGYQPVAQIVATKPQ